MDLQYNPGSTDHLVSSSKLLDAALKATNIDEFSEQGLSILSAILQTSWSFLYVKETKHLTARFFQYGLTPDKARSVSNMADGLFEESLKGPESQLHNSITTADGQEWSVQLYKLHHNAKVHGIIGISHNKDCHPLQINVRVYMINFVVQIIDMLLEKEDVLHNLSHLQTYQTVSSLLAQSLDLHDLLDIALYTCMDVVSAEAASVLLLTDDKKYVNFYQVEGGAKPLLSDKSFPADTGIAGSVLMARQSEIVHDVQNDPRFYGNIDSETGFKTKSMIVVPLLAGEEPVGVLEVINKVDGNKFTDKEHLLLCSIAEEIAFAIRNAKVFDYIVGTYCKQRQGQMSCKGCKRPLGSWTPCVKYQESEFKKAAVIEPTIYHNLDSNETLKGIDNDRRLYKREKVTLPAFIGEANSKSDEYETGTVLDISLAGIRFFVPKGTILGSKEHRKSTEFTVIFILTHERQPTKVKCQSKYFLATEKGIEIGANFIDPDAQICRTLQNYLI